MTSIIQTLQEDDPCALACTQGSFYEKFSLHSVMGELFLPVPGLLLPAGVLIAISFSRINDGKMLWHRSLLVLFLNLLLFTVCPRAKFVCVCVF